MNNSTTTNVSDTETGSKIPLGYHIVAYMVLVLGFSANSFICFSFAYFRRVRSLNNYFVVNLAVIDILFLVLLCFQLAAPALKKKMLLKDFSYLVEALIIIETFCYSACVAAVTIISYDRYYAVTKPLHYTTSITHTKAIIFIGSNWTYATVMALLQFLIYLPNENYFKYGYLSLMGLTNALIPLIVVLYCYVKIFIIASRHLRHNPHRGRDRNGEASVFSKNLRIAFHILVLVAPILLFWSAFCAVTITEFHCSDCIRDFSTLGIIMSMGPNVTASVDPIIYIFLTKDFREIICGWFRLHSPFPVSETFHLSTTKSTNHQVLPASERLVSESGDSLAGSYRHY
ncbi:histamine H2 receptor-like [Stylophora pistillata]|uniref:histamine H2 receptor-like n=1 Tax=Stylophora pistillata TaxID=50429 RepID=UPI000C0508BD|nr:histamine H2 receptor-like [Stylophora pistillata]